MTKTTNETLRVSKCHHASLEKIREPHDPDNSDKNLTTKPIESFRCAFCKQPCEVVELLLEEK